MSDDPDEGHPDEREARKIIMARRQFFITSALAGVALAGCDKKGPDGLPPHVCLEMAPVPDPTPEPPMTAAPQGSGSAEPSAAPSAEPAPRVCLDVVAPEPTVCLDMPAPPEDGRRDRTKTKG